MGQKTKKLYFWLTDADAAACSDALHAALPDLRWQCVHSGLNPPVHTLNTLDEALACGDDHAFVRQAFAPLALSALQFSVRRPQRMIDARDGYAPTYQFAPEIGAVEHGYMAIRWLTDDGDASALAALDTQLRIIWKAVQRATLPAKVHTLSGRQLAGFRIGQQMLEQVRAEGLYLRANGPFCLPD